MPKALRRRQANSPVRSFPHKSTEVRDGRGQELPSNSDAEPNCQDVFGHTKPCDGEATLDQNRSCDATENQRIILFLGSKRFHKTPIAVCLGSGDSQRDHEGVFIPDLPDLATTCIVNPCY